MICLQETKIEERGGGGVGLMWDKWVVEQRDCFVGIHGLLAVSKCER